MNATAQNRWRTWGPLLLTLAILAALVAWVANRTYWVNEPVYLPLRGEAAINPFYAAQRLAESLGAHTEWHHELLGDPPQDSLIVLAQWNWILIPERRQRLERWVEAGGRLVVDAEVLRTTRFVEWTGMSVHDPATASRVPSADAWALRADRKPLWAERRDGKVIAMRARVGQGTVTAFRDPVYVERALLSDENARMFVAGAGLRAGDRIYFLSDGRGASLLQLLWDYLAPAVTLGLGVILMALWRASARFGPLAAGADPARRSLAEQIRGTSRFIVRFGGSALHAAEVRALNEVALRHVPRFKEMTGRQRIEALASATGLDADEIAAALDRSRKRRPAELRGVLAFLELARRGISPRART